ncbi:vacuolar iron transporter homolog 2-like [Typha angustifolia]|uniref:vacuolar iron transporter homolog 2-like n=1 Tax=Typha angustifolia TaxID=59011 RepID=UPI003C2DEDF0
MANHTPISITHEPTNEEKETTRAQRSQWLRAAILGASDGLLSTTSLMLGVGAAKQDHRSTIISGAAGAVAGAFSMAVGEFVSVSTQRDIEIAGGEAKTAPTPKTSPNPVKAAAASGFAFVAGSLVPLLPGYFVKEYHVRILALVIVASAALAAFGGVGARLGGSPACVSAVRVLVGGWVAMGITYWMLKPLEKDDGRDLNY